MTAETEVPSWVWLLAVSVGGPIMVKVLDVLFSRVVRKEDERAAAFDRKLEDVSQALIHLREYMRDRFDQLRAEREADSRTLTERVHEIERSLPDQLRKAKHDAIDALAPRIGKYEDRVHDLEERVTRLETQDERLRAANR
jgi:hypothetical protein